MPITFSCPRCNKTLKAPAAAAGKSSPCPGCGAMATCPEPVYEAEVVLISPKKTPPATPSPQKPPPRNLSPAAPVPKKPPTVNPYADLDDDKPYALVNPPPPAAAESSPEIRRPCPACGERILAEAAVSAGSAVRYSTRCSRRAKVKKPKKSTRSNVRSRWPRLGGRIPLLRHRYGPHCGVVRERRLAAGGRTLYGLLRSDPRGHCRDVSRHVWAGEVGSLAGESHQRTGDQRSHERRFVTQCRPSFHAPAGPRSSSLKVVRARLFVARGARPS